MKIKEIFKVTMMSYLLILYELLPFHPVNQLEDLLLLQFPYIMISKIYINQYLNMMINEVKKIQIRIFLF